MPELFGLCCCEEKGEYGCSDKDEGFGAVCIDKFKDDYVGESLLILEDCISETLGKLPYGLT